MSRTSLVPLAKSASFPQSTSSGLALVFPGSGSRYTLAEVKSLPPFDPGCVSVVSCDNVVDADRELAQLHPGPLGWDMEWKWDAKAKTSGRIALVQVADRERAVLVRTTNMQALPQRLVSILVDPTVLKVGVNIRGDGRKVFEDYGVRPAGLFELSRGAMIVDAYFWRDRNSGLLIKLQHLAAKYLEQYLSKDEQQSDWEQDLTDEQRAYAAADAIAGIRIFDAMLSKASEMDPAVDLHSRIDCRVNYDDPDPYAQPHTAPMRKTYSAPALLASAPSYRVATTPVNELDVVRAAAPAAAPTPTPIHVSLSTSRSSTPEITPEVVNGNEGPASNSTTVVEEDDSDTTFHWSAEDEEAMRKLESDISLEDDAACETGADASSPEDDYNGFTLTEGEETAHVKLEQTTAPVRKRSASDANTGVSLKRRRISDTPEPALSKTLDEVPTSDDPALR